jgi:putative DNA methylase
VRMIERWFPCAEVSEASTSGWGSGNQEAALFTWFAKRPLAQARAAVLTSLLPWPEDEEEQRRLQHLVRRAMTGREVAQAEVQRELERLYPGGASLLDPFSGRGMIPLEGARYGVAAHGLDYSPVATLAGQLLADYPLRDWQAEPELPVAWATCSLVGNRLADDVESLFVEIGARYTEAMQDFYPKHDGQAPWGYLWAVSLPCQECGRRFPLVASLALRHPAPTRNDRGQSYRLEPDHTTGQVRVVVHNGPPIGNPTLVATPRTRGKSAVCPFCNHFHAKALHTRLAADGYGEDVLLVAADISNSTGKSFRQPSEADLLAVTKVTEALASESPFPGGLAAVPDEAIPAGNNHTVRASMYGARTYGDLCTARQTLAFVRLARVISEVGAELLAANVDVAYAAALTGYAGACLARKFRQSTRGARLQATVGNAKTGDLFTNEASLAFSYDFFEAGIGAGPGTWNSLAKDTLSVLRRQATGHGARPADIRRASAVAVPLRSASLSAIVTDPPYDNMIDYSDASDLYFVWLKRALGATHPWFGFTAHPSGVQEKDDEIIVKGAGNIDHRTRQHYDRMISRAFAEARRVVSTDGVVTIVFGHGDPEVWHRLLGAITRAGLTLTGSWPAKTESGGSAGSANIVTTLTMSCRPAGVDRPNGRANIVEADVRREVQSRVPMWDAAGLAPTDQLMASAGPAMEAVGRYEQVLDHLGEPVDPAHYLVIARKAVVESTSTPIDNLALDTFDARTRFALGWARLYRRSTAPKSEARWQALAADLTMDDLKGVLAEADKGVRLAPAAAWKGTVEPTSSVIDVAMAMAKAWTNGLDDVAQVLVAAERDADDTYLWATIGYLSSLLPEGDPDAVAWTSLVRARRGLGSVARGVASAHREADEARDRQQSLFDTDSMGATS